MSIVEGLLAEAEGKVNTLQISQEHHEASKQRLAQIDLDDPDLFNSDDPIDAANKFNHCREICQLIARRCKVSRVNLDAILIVVMRKLNAGFKITEDGGVSEDVKVNDYFANRLESILRETTVQRVAKR